MASRFDQDPVFDGLAQPDADNWLNEYFAQIARDLRKLTNEKIVAPRNSEPPRKYDGLIQFADGTNWDPGSGRGMYYWDSEAGGSGAWVPMFV